MATATEIHQLYIAYFGRPPDFTGYTGNLTDLTATPPFAGQSVDQIFATFSASSESQALLGSTTLSTQINNIYQNLFNRSPDVPGLTYWTQQISAGTVSLAKAAFAILKGAIGDDLLIVNNKVDASTSFYTSLVSSPDNINGYVGTAAAATARTQLATVTKETATVTAYTSGLAAQLASINAATSSPPTGSSFTLTTNVETVTGTAANDSFAANALNGAVTFNAGDIVNGGSGIDTLRLTANDDTQIAQLNSVENVDVRLLSSIDLNALDFSGTTTISIISDSTNDLTLTVLNANQSTTFKIADDANLIIDFLDDSGSGDVAKLAADNAGVSGSAATFTISATEAVTLGVSGTSFVQVSAGDTSLNSVSVSGVGTLSLTVGETSLSGLSLAGFSGTSDVTIGAASNLSVTGGAGNDTINFGTTFNGSDTVNGGSGTDVLTASVQGLVGLTRVTNVETATFTAGTTTTIIDASGASVSTINIAEITGAIDLTINNLGTVELNLANVGTDGSISLDYAGTNANVDLTQPSAATYNTLTITDASGVDVSVDGGSGTVTFSAVSLDSDAKALVIGANSGSITMSSIAAAGLTSLNVNVAGSGDFLNTAFVASSLGTVSLLGNGASAEIDVGALSTDGAALSVTTLASGDKASVVVGDLTASGAATLSIQSNGSGAVADAGNIQFGTAASTLTLSANGASAEADVGAIGLRASGSYTLTVSASGAAASADVGNVTALTSGSLTVSLNAAADSNVVVGTITTGTAGAAFTLTAVAAGSGDITVGDITVGEDGATTATTASIAFTGGSGDVTFSAIEAFTVSSIVGTVGDAGSATIDVVSANTIGNVTLAGSGTVTIDALDASGIGNITVGDGVLVASAIANTIGNISIGGDGATLNLSAAVSVGNIVVSGSGGATINNATLSASFGNITIAGHGTASIDVGNATGVGSVSTVGHSGSVTLQFGSAVDQVVGSLGAGSNEVFISLAGSAAGSLNGDIYTLVAGTGIADFHILSTGNSDAVISNFDLSSAADRFSFATASIELGYAASAGVVDNAAGALQVEDFAASASVAAATDVVVLRSGTFASIDAVLAAIGTNGAYELKASTATTAGLDLIVAWADTNGSTHITLVNTVSAAAGNALFSSTSNTNDIALLDGVNIATFSGADFQATFFAE